MCGWWSPQVDCSSNANYYFFGKVLIKRLSLVKTLGLKRPFASSFLFLLLGARGMCGWWSPQVDRGLQLLHCSDGKSRGGCSASSLRQSGIRTRYHGHPTDTAGCIYLSLPFIPSSGTHIQNIPDSKVHGANMGSIWGRQDPGGAHVGPMNFAIWDHAIQLVELVIVDQP